MKMGYIFKEIFYVNNAEEFLSLIDRSEVAK